MFSKGLRHWASMAGFALLPILYFLVYGSVGIDGTDGGFIHGLSWRILNGQEIYRDFIYIRPPLTPLLHTIPMYLLPANWVIKGERLIFFLMMAASSAFFAFGLEKKLNFKELKLNPWLIATGGFIISVHNYPVMPWHTSDGIFFASIGCFFLLRSSKIPALILGACCMVLAALTKQSFYFLVPASVLAVWLMEGRRSGLIMLGIIAGLSLLVIGGWWGLFPENFQAFLTQTSGATSIRDFLVAATIPYAKGLIWIVPVLFFFLLRDKLGNYEVGRSLAQFSMWLLMIIPILFHMVWSNYREVFTPPAFAYMQGMWLAGLAAMLLILFREKEKAVWGVLLTFLVSWCGGLSWGYQTPALAMTPVIAALIWFIYTEYEPKFLSFFLPAVFLFWAFAFGAIRDYPYREPVAAGQLEWEMQEVFPKLSGIMSSNVNEAKFKELKALRSELGGNYTVAPAMSFAHFLTDDIPTFPVDWMHNAELRWDQDSLAVIDAFERLDYVLVEKDKLDEADRKGKYGSSAMKYIMTQWRIEREAAYYYVYKP